MTEKNENTTPAPINHYGRTKWSAEQMIINSSLNNWSIVRTVLVYGYTQNRSRSNIILWIKENLENKRPIKVVTDQWRTPTLAEDLAYGCWLVAENKKNGIFHISGEQLMTPYDMAIKTAEVFNLDRSLISKVNAATFTQPAKRPHKTGFVINKAKIELGYLPHTFEEGLKIMVAQINDITQ